VAGLAAAVSVAVGLEVVRPEVVRLAVSAAGLGGSAQPRLAAVSAELDLTAPAAEASVLAVFAAGAFRSPQVLDSGAGATTTPALFGPAIIGSTSATDPESGLASFVIRMANGTGQTVETGSQRVQENGVPKWIARATKGRRPTNSRSATISHGVSNLGCRKNWVMVAPRTGGPTSS
jgi:hypothetical protein